MKNCMTKVSALLTALLVAISITALISSQETQTIQHPKTKENLKLFPNTFDDLPDIPSPFTTKGGMEVVVAFMKNKKYALIPVTVANGPLNLQYGAEKIGKGKQLKVDADDFPTLAKTGLHSEKELDQTRSITGKSITEITRIGRPEASSAAGFMSHDEDIISVLKGDNRLVQKLGLTHPQMAKPLFHVWNLILKEYELGNMGRYWDNIQYVLYNGLKIRFGEVHPMRGFQESIFNDEIKGAFQINFYRELSEKEKSLLRKKYSHLNKEQTADFIKKLSRILMGEMEPYYVMRYGFYEGHTSYRVDPIAIAFIFGLRSLEEIENAFEGSLNKALTEHFTGENITLHPELFNQSIIICRIINHATFSFLLR
jgi:hypothetical protein